MTLRVFSISLRAAAASERERTEPLLGQHNVRVRDQVRIGPRAVGDESGHEAARLERQGDLLVLSALEQHADQHPRNELLLVGAQVIAAG